MFSLLALFHTLSTLFHNSYILLCSIKRLNAPRQAEPRKLCLDFAPVALSTRLHTVEVRSSRMGAAGSRDLSCAHNLNLHVFIEASSDAIRGILTLAEAARR